MLTVEMMTCRHEEWKQLEAVCVAGSLYPRTAK